MAGHIIPKREAIYLAHIIYEGKYWTSDAGIFDGVIVAMFEHETNMTGNDFLMEYTECDNQDCIYWEHWSLI